MNIINSRPQAPELIETGVWYSILATAFFLALSPPLTTAALITGVAFWMVKLFITRGRVWKRTPCDALVVLLVVLSAISITASPDWQFSFYNYYNLMGRYVLLYYLVAQNVDSPAKVAAIARALFGAALLVAVYGLYQYFCSADTINELWIDAQYFPGLKKRMFSTLYNPNILAGYLTVMMTLLFGVMVKTADRAARITLGLLWLLLGVCLALTLSRGAMLSLLATLVLYSALKKRLVLLMLLACALVALLGVDGISERIISSFHPSDTSASLRLALWESTTAMIREHPWFGVGWGAYWMVYPEYNFYINDAAVKIVHAHNMYLNFAAEIGIAGMLSFVAVMLAHFRLAVTSGADFGDEHVNGLLLGTALSIVAVALNGFTDYVLFNIELSMLFWLLNALTVAVAGGRRFSGSRLRMNM